MLTTPSALPRGERGEKRGTVLRKSVLSKVVFSSILPVRYPLILADAAEKREYFTQVQRTSFFPPLPFVGEGSGVRGFPGDKAS
jgi:hypothetical protein